MGAQISSVCFTRLSFYPNRLTTGANMCCLCLYSMSWWLPVCLKHRTVHLCPHLNTDINSWAEKKGEAFGCVLPSLRRALWTTSEKSQNGIQRLSKAQIDSLIFRKELRCHYQRSVFNFWHTSLSPGRASLQNLICALSCCSVWTDEGLQRRRTSPFSPKASNNQWRRHRSWQVLKHDQHPLFMRFIKLMKLVGF